MAVSYLAVVGTTDYGFDWVDEEIEVESGVADVTAVDLKQAIREAEASVEGIVFGQIGTTFNPVELTPTASTFLNVILADAWKILSLSGSGTLTVGEGNVVAEVDGIDIFAPNANVTYVNNTSSAGVLVESGVSGLTAAEATQLIEIYTRLGLNVADPITDVPGGIDSDSGDINIDRTGDGVTSSTLTRQP